MDDVGLPNPREERRAIRVEGEGVTAAAHRACMTDEARGTPILQDHLRDVRSAPNEEVGGREDERVDLMHLTSM